MDFLIKFAQYHESFRQAEIEALAVVEKVDLTILSYDADVSHSILVYRRPQLTSMINSSLHTVQFVSQT